MPLLLLAAQIVAVWEALITGKLSPLNCILIWLSVTEPRDHDVGENHNAIALQTNFTSTITRRSTDYQSVVNTSTIAASGSYPVTFNPRIDGIRHWIMFFSEQNSRISWVVWVPKHLDLMITGIRL